MRYYMPTEVYAEDNSVRKHAGEIACCGRKALIVTGRGSAFRNGSYDDVKAALDEYGIPSVTFSEIEENPSTETVMRTRDFGLSERADFVIGIGGGSPLDAAKAAALMMAHPDRSIDMLYEKGGDPAHLPVIAVPTTCGTGSEVTGVSVLTNHAKKSKGSIPYKIWPRLALIDGKYLRHAPSRVIRNTSVDALCHLMECALSSAGSAMSQMPVRAGLLKWAETKDLLLTLSDGICGQRRGSLSGREEQVSMPQDGMIQEAVAEMSGNQREETDSEDALGTEEREALMLSSAFAGMAIAQSGTSLPHALSYVLTYDLGIPHGAACGYFLPAFLREAPEKERKALLGLAGFSDTEELAEYLKAVIGPVEVPKEVLQRSFEVVRSAPAKMQSAAFFMDEEVLEKITYHGDFA